LNLERIDIWPVRLPALKTFTFASGSAGAGGASHVFVRVTDSDGATGWGEARPVAGWSCETLGTVARTLRDELAPAVTGMPATDRLGLHARMNRVIGRGPSTGQPIAKAALDIALHDLLARRAGLPLVAFLGGAPPEAPMPLSYTVTAHDEDGARAEAESALEAGFRHVNFKAAVAPETDAAVAEALRGVLPPEAFLWADANQGFTLHAARRVAGLFARIGVDVLEQPLPADQLLLMRRLRQNCDVALAVDETSVSPADFFTHAAEGLVDFLVIKLTRSGGIGPTLEQIACARAAGLALLVSGLTDGMIVKLAALHTAAAYGYTGPSALNGSQFTDETALFPDKAAFEKDGHLTLGDRPGLGIEPDLEALERYRVDVGS